MDLGSRVRAERRARNLSQEALARQADLSLNLVNRIERGVITDPHYSTLVSLAGALGLSVADLVGESQAPLARASLGSTDEERRHYEHLGALQTLRQLVGQLYEQWEGNPESASPEIALGLLLTLSDKGVLGGVSGREYLPEDIQLELLQLTPAVMNLCAVAESVATEAQVVDLEEARRRLRVA